ncbi:hypothetical protein F2Q68_00037813 [Brassica cretica]|uniref:Uncharacterized protein n=2 Tax=Brassica cretica TaxID=69181 RepID=A0A3N6PNS8_BRACR|nr:hypothetical protein F2Q68_00037813 [Brassica cretica]KAF3593610.1 hypothetical protein DY000_02027886 [Brassica cretica]
MLGMWSGKYDKYGRTMAPGSVPERGSCDKCGDEKPPLQQTQCMHYTLCERCLGGCYSPIFYNPRFRCDVCEQWNKARKAARAAAGEAAGSG